MAVIIDNDQILRAAEHASHGLLLGVTRSNDVVVTTMCNGLSSADCTWLPSGIDVDTIYQYLPAGVELVGLFTSVQLAKHVNWQKELEDFIVLQKCDAMIRIIVVLDKDSGKLNCYNRDYVAMTTVASVQEYLDLYFITLHIKHHIKANIPEDLKHVTNSMTGIKDMIKDSKLHLPQCNIIASDEGADTVSNKCPRMLAAQLLEHNVADKVCPPTLSLIPCDHTYSIPVPINVVGVAVRTSRLSNIVREMKEKVLNQLTLVAQCVEEDHCVPLIHQYKLDYIPLSVLYPCSNIVDGSLCNDQDLLPRRQLLHKTFCLPFTRPHFRLSNIKWAGLDDSKYLISPHLHLKTPKQGSVAMVTGSYSYHHYMQDGIDDSGWGCAYRALQTLWSWFLYQGYTSRPIPNHREIQSTLVDCGDKLSSFVGSTEWIGSVEVSIVLNHLLEVNSKLHHIATGNNMADTGRVLLHHFTSQGTPVMIGGGVLAHTILGVQYDEQTGDIKYLVLDPHYTGQDEVKHVIGKWCGWKTPTFWDEAASYNMCMPMRPNAY